MTTWGNAYYDLKRNPPSFNCQDFLLTAERWRASHRLDRLRVFVLPGPVDGFRNDRLPPYGAEERQRWLRNIVLPMAELLPSCGAPAVEVSRDHRLGDLEFGRDQYTVGLPRAVNAAKGGIYPFRAKQSLVECYKRKYEAPHGYVTITLRDTGWWTERSSNLVEWLKVADVLTSRGFAVVFVPDGTKPETKIDGQITNAIAAQRVEFRAALYAGAAMNLGINNGPMWLCWFMGVPTVMCKLVNNNEPCAGASSFSSAGLAPGSQMPNARRAQLMVWDQDRADIVLAAFEKAISEI